MPRMSQMPEEHQLAKLLLIGDGKLGKSFYAAMAAAAGFNVLYLDGDVARATIGKMGQGDKPVLDADSMGRIFLLDVRDTLIGGRKDSKMFDTIVEFSSSVVFKWNDSEQRLAKRGDTGELWEIKPAYIDHNTVLVLDSWTSLCESIMTAAAIAHSVDLANASTSEMRPVYQSAGLKATQLLQLIRSLRCHVIVIGHPDEYSHTTKPDGKRVKDIKETDLVVDWTKMIPRSTSKPHGLQLAKYFTDVAWMQVNGSGTQRMLNFRVSDDKVSGGHFTDLKSAEEYSFANLVREVGGSIPQSGASFDSWLNIVPAGAAQPVESPKVLDGTMATPVKAPGMAGLFSPKSKP